MNQRFRRALHRVIGHKYRWINGVMTWECETCDLFHTHRPPWSRVADEHMRKAAAAHIDTPRCQHCAAPGPDGEGAK